MEKVQCHLKAAHEPARRSASGSKTATISGDSAICFGKEARGLAQITMILERKGYRWQMVYHDRNTGYACHGVKHQKRAYCILPIK
jgi:hypothetical protein